MKKLLLVLALLFPLALSAAPTKEQVRAHCEAALQSDASTVLTLREQGVPIEFIVQNFTDSAAENGLPDTVRDAILAFFMALYGTDGNVVMGAYQNAAAACTTHLHKVKA